MCTVVVLRRPDHAWPLLLAGNRDEMRDRPWRPPARHWPEHPGVVAGLDELGGGSWLGVNHHGVVAVVMNRIGTLGPLAGKRSRGGLVLQALDHASAGAAADDLARLPPTAYRAFNLVIGDAERLYWLRLVGRDGEGSAPAIEVSEVPEGLHMLSALELDDTSLPRMRTYLPRFRDAAVPDPARGDWESWQTLLACRDHAAADGPLAAMNVALPGGPGGFGTVCSQLIAVPRGVEPCEAGVGSAVAGPLFRFAAGPPDKAPFVAVEL